MRNVGTFKGGENGALNSFVVRLSRSANLGWALFLVTLMLLFATWLFIIFLPPSVMAVDDKGNFLGHVTFSNDVARTDTEILGAAKRFSMCYWSLNAPTIEMDTACALAMMDKRRFHDNKLSLYDRRIKELKETNFISIVKVAQNRTSVEFDDETRFIDTLTMTINNNDGTVQKIPYKRVLISGSIKALGTKRIIRKFKQELFLKPVPRNSFDSLGVVVSEINDI